MKHQFARLRKNILHVEPSERKPFTYLFIHAFFNGLGVALAFAAINIIVIEKQGIEILPYLYIATSVLLIVAGYLYSILEHSFPAKRVFIFSLVFCVVWAVAMRFFLAPHNSLVFVGLAYSTYYLILVLTNLDLWGSAALLFNVRQSKRLFGPLSFSESIGSIAGFSMTPVIISLIAVENIMILSGASFLISLIVLYSLRSNYLSADHHNAEAQTLLHEPVHHQHKSFWSRLFHGNQYIKWLSLIMLISTLVYYTLTFGFLSRVEVQFTDLTDIAWFIGIFLSVAKILNLIIKFIVSTHVFTRLGVAFGMYLLPIIIFVSCLIGVFIMYIYQPDSIFYVYLFSALYFFDKLLRSSLSKPSFLILFQPLTPSLRLSGHTITKGYFEPLGMGLAGLFIVIEQYLGLISIEAFVVYILILSIVWVAACRKGVEQYAHELQEALHSRLFGSTPFTLSKTEFDVIVETKLKSEDAIDRLYALSLVNGKIDPTEEASHYVDLLSAKHHEVLLTCLKKLEELKHDVPIEKILPLLESPNQKVRQQAGYTMAAIHSEKAIEELTKRIGDSPKDNNVFIGALIKYSGIRGTLAVGHKFMALTQSEIPEERVLAARIIRSAVNPELNDLLPALINDDDIQVATEAIRACGAQTSKDLLGHVINKVENRFLILPIKRCVAQNQDIAKEIIDEMYDKADRQIKLRLIDICQKIESSENIEFLISMVNYPDLQISSRAVQSLFALPSNVIQTIHRRLLEESISTKIKEVVLLSKTYNTARGPEVFDSALVNEMRELYFKDILRLLSLIYSRETLEIIIHNLSLNEESQIANAIELLENILPNKWSNQLIPVIEQSYSSVSNRIDTGNSIDRLVNIVTDESVRISDFLTGLLIRFSYKEQIELPQQFYTLVSQKNSPIIGEELAISNQ